MSERAVPFRSQIRGQLKGRMEALEARAVEMYARGLSTRDIEEAFRDEDGQVVLSRTAVREVTEEHWPEVRARVKACYKAPSAEVAKALRDDFVRRCQGELPSAVQCFEDDFDGCVAYPRFPITHRKVIRTTTSLERLFEEERRRLKIIANALGERSVLELVYVALLRASEPWRGLKISVFELKQLQTIRQKLDHEHRRRHAPAVNSDGCVPSPKSSRVRR